MLKQIDKDNFYALQRDVNCSLSVVRIHGNYHTLFVNKKHNYVFGVVVDDRYFLVPEKYKLNRFFVCNSVLQVTFLNNFCFVDHWKLMKIEKKQFVDFLRNHYYTYATKVSVKSDHVSFSFTANGDYLVKTRKDNNHSFVSHVVYNGNDMDEAISTYNQLISWLHVVKRYIGGAI